MEDLEWIKEINDNPEYVQVTISSYHRNIAKFSENEYMVRDNNKIRLLISNIDWVECVKINFCQEAKHFYTLRVRSAPCRISRIECYDGSVFFEENYYFYLFYTPHIDNRRGIQMNDWICGTKDDKFYKHEVADVEIIDGKYYANFSIGKSTKAVR